MVAPAKTIVPDAMPDFVQHYICRLRFANGNGGIDVNAARQIMRVVGMRLRVNVARRARSNDYHHAGPPPGDERR